MKLDITYATASYYPPSDVSTIVADRGPVIPAYSGWQSDPSRGSVLILGLGYEYEQALGMVEFLEPAQTWLFLPTGSDSEFDQQVRAINNDLIGFIGPEWVVEYPP